MKTLRLITLALVGVACVASASAYEDDLYTPKDKGVSKTKKSTTKQSSVVPSTKSGSYYTPGMVDDYDNDYASADSYNFDSGSTRDVDEYNRRYQFQSIASDGGELTDSAAYMQGIKDYYNPQIVSSRQSQDFIDYYNQDSPSQVNIYVNSNDWLWYHLNRPYYRWSTWYWDYPYYSWYSPFYSWYYPYYSHTYWSWGWGGWSWGWSRPWYHGGWYGYHYPHYGTHYGHHYGYGRHTSPGANRPFGIGRGGQSGSNRPSYGGSRYGGSGSHPTNRLGDGYRGNNFSVGGAGSHTVGGHRVGGFSSGRVSSSPSTSFGGSRPSGSGKVSSSPSSGYRSSSPSSSSTGGYRSTPSSSYSGGSSSGRSSGGYSGNSSRSSSYSSGGSRSGGFSGGSRSSGGGFSGGGHSGGGGHSSGGHRR